MLMTVNWVAITAAPLLFAMIITQDTLQSHHFYISTALLGFWLIASLVFIVSRTIFVINNESL